MKDNFSKQAVEYSKFRPDYPAEMIDYILSFVKDTCSALDIATGNGQVAVKLSAYFTSVFATDISQDQLDNAVQGHNIKYIKESAEKTSFIDQQFDLVTVAQAVHWFNFETFYPEIKRILKPDGIFAILGYGLFSTNPETDKIIDEFYTQIVGPYWDLERRYLDENYETIPFPFNEIETKKFSNNFNWNFEQLIGYLETWSATQHYKNKNNSNPIDLIYDSLKKSWEDSDGNVCFPLLLRIGKIN